MHPKYKLFFRKYGTLMLDLNRNDGKVFLKWKYLGRVLVHGCKAVVSVTDVMWKNLFIQGTHVYIT